jgi:6-phosphogluconolactonase
VWKIDNDHVCTGEVITELSTAEKAHFIVTDPSKRFAYVPHTAPNAVYQFSLDADTGKLTPLDPPFAKGPDEDHGYHQPRHLAFHPALSMAYTANERGGGISAWKVDPKTGALSLQETLSTLPPGWEGASAGADIHITPNGRFVYMSNRDTRKLEDGVAPGDTLAGFEIHPETGALKLIGHFPTEAFPRSFCIDRTGNFVYAAGQRADKMAAYRIDQQNGQLEKIATYPTGQTPIWVMCWGE